MSAVTASIRGRRPVDVGRRIPFPADLVSDIIQNDPAGALGTTASASDGEGVVPMGVHLGRRLRLQREVTVGFGPFIEEDDGTVTLALWWEAAHQPWLFPTFDGGLEVHDRRDGTELRLVGSYQLPLGQAGVFADEFIGHRVARASLDAFLEEIAASVTARLTKSTY